MATGQQTDRVLPLRKVIHLAGAGFPLLYLVVQRQVVLILAVIVLILVVAVEWGRRQWPWLEQLFEWLIGPALREGEERKPTTGVWSMLGIIVTLLGFSKEFAIPAMLYAQVGDPVAEVFGRRWGRHRFKSGKSLEGSLGCFIVSLVVGLACSQVLDLSPGIAALGALVATLTEVMPLPVGDNLLMAPVAGLAMTLGERVFT